jgi:hypothetical protein
MASTSSEPCRQANGGKTGFNALAQGIEPALHAANALEQTGLDQGGNGFAVFVDDDAVLPVLHLVEHFAQVLPKGDGAGLGDHGQFPPVKSC